MRRRSVRLLLAGADEYQYDGAGVLVGAVLLPLEAGTTAVAY